MRAFVISCLVLITSGPCLAQSAKFIALEDSQFDAWFAKAPVPVVTGKLIAISPQERAATTITYTLVTLYGQVKKTAPLAVDGTFQLQLDYSLPYQQIWLQVGELFYAGLYANRDLHLELNGAVLKAQGQGVQFNGPGIRYTGTDGPLNAYMNEYVLFKRAEQLALSERIQQIPRSGKPVATQLLAAYGPIFDSLKIIQDEYIAAHPAPYGWLLENERLSELYGQLCVRYWGHAMEDTLFAQISTHKTYLLSNSSTLFYRYLSQYLRLSPANRVRISWQDVAQLSNLDASEKALVDSLRATATQSPAPPRLSQWQKQLQPRMSQLLADRLVARNISLLDSLFPAAKADLLKLQLADSKDIVEQKSALARLLPSMRTEWCRRIAQAKYTQSVEKVATVNRALSSSVHSVGVTGFGPPMQQTAFGATLYKLSAMGGRAFLAKLRQSFAGKAIVLDRWATWCAPCLAEMPHSKKLQQESKQLPVVFVYVCTASGSDEGRWKRKVAELQLPGIHFFVDEALDAEVGQYFSFSGYPGYALIDQRGVYKPGAINRISAIKDKQALATLLR